MIQAPEPVSRLNQESAAGGCSPASSFPVDDPADLVYSFVMHGPFPPHNPLRHAAQEFRAVARETKSRWFEGAALVIMAISAAVTTAMGALQIRHMLRREMKEEEREKERERDRRSAPASPPPDRPGQGGAASTGMPGHGRDGDDRHWTRREDELHGSHAHARQR